MLGGSNLDNSRSAFESDLLRDYIYFVILSQQIIICTFPNSCTLSFLSLLVSQSWRSKAYYKLNIENYVLLYWSFKVNCWPHILPLVLLGFHWIKVCILVASFAAGSCSH